VPDFGRYIAGPFCGALLADLGADVIRIEKIGGSEDRYLGPIAPAGEGALFIQCNRGNSDCDCGTCVNNYCASGLGMCM